MIKKRFRKYLPDPQTIKNLRGVHFLGDILHDTRLWHFNRRSIANAFALGLFVMWMPVPMQMLFAAALAIPCRANLPLAVSLVWISNPLTIAPMYFGAYVFGVWLLQQEAQFVEFDISVEWLTDGLSQIWEPFLLGCLLLGLMSAALGYGVINLVWRLYVLKMLEKRKLRKNGNGRNAA